MTSYLYCMRVVLLYSLYQVLVPGTEYRTCYENKNRTELV